MMDIQEIPTAAPQRRSRIAKIVKRVTIGIVVLYALMVIVRTGQLLHADETAKKVADIHSIRLTLADVDGSRLPPAPDPGQNDATVAGIDVNHNYVRDDIERWIFATYPDQKERAVWMQWARAEQMVMTHAINKETLVAIMEEGDRAMQCASSLYMSQPYQKSFIEYGDLEKTMRDRIINTPLRKGALEAGYKFMTGSGPMEGEQCDVFPEVK